jgi:hypothetical protein
MSISGPSPANWDPEIGQLRQGAGGILGQGISAWGKPLDSGESARQAAQQGLYQGATSRLDPMWNQREAAQRAQLTAQGLDPGSAAALRATGDLGRQRTDAYNQALFGSMAGGAQAAAQQQQLDLNSRMAPIQAGLGLLGGASSLQGQQFDEATSQAKMKNQFWGGLLGGAANLGGSLGAAAIMA